MRSLAIILMLIPGLASAHARLTSPTPRNSRDDVKDGTCGGPRSSNVHVLSTGVTVPVAWEETINHAGHFEILFSTANDQGFAFLKDPSGNVLSNIPHSSAGATPRPYSLTVQLPAQACDACTLLLKQFMSDTNSYYYSCADVRLVPPGSDLATGPVDLGAAQPLDLAVTSRDASSAANPTSDEPRAAAMGGCGILGGSTPTAATGLLALIFLFTTRAIPRAGRRSERRRW